MTGNIRSVASGIEPAGQAAVQVEGPALWLITVPAALALEACRFDADLKLNANGHSLNHAAPSIRPTMSSSRARDFRKREFRSTLEDPVSAVFAELSTTSGDKRETTAVPKVGALQPGNNLTKAMMMCSSPASAAHADVPLNHAP